MPLSKKDKEFNLPQVTHVDFKSVSMDRVLTGLFERLRHKGGTGQLTGRREVTVEGIRSEFLTNQGEYFRGFDQYPAIFDRWLEGHLLDVVNRGKKTQAVAAPRPLHGYTYRFRNTRHSKDYGTARHLYEMLYYARDGRGGAAIDALRAYLFAGVDLATDSEDPGIDVDVEAQALLRLCSQVKQDVRVAPDESRPEPLCVGQADLLADDLLRLLVYQRHIPRSVLIEYLKILLAFHLALYHVKLIRMAPRLVRDAVSGPACAKPICPSTPSQLAAESGCPYRVGMFVDLTDNPKTATARLAERSAESLYQGIPAFVRSVFTLKKLDDFAAYLTKVSSKLSRPKEGYFRVGDLLSLQGKTYEQDRKDYFGQAVARVIGEDTQEEVSPDTQAVLDLNLSRFDTYVELLMLHRGDAPRAAMVRFLDAVMLKNQPGGLLAQKAGNRQPRRFSLDGRLLEILIQLAVLEPGTGTHPYRTRPIRIDALLATLRERYGLYIDRLPPDDRFSEASIEDRQAVRANVVAFKARLREIGFYRDLSDAYITQTVTPRYDILD